MGEQRISSGSTTPLPLRVGVPASPHFGVPFYLCTHALTQNYQIWRDHTCRRGLDLESFTPQPQAAGFERSPTLGVPFYLCIHHLSQNYQIWRGNTYREGLVLWGHPRPTPRGRGPSAPQFWSSFLFMRKPFIAEVL